MFPQVALGQILRTEPALGDAADAAYRAINSKRCDLLLADRSGFPVAVLEFQGSGHYVGDTARQRDEIKRRALERAGIRYVEIHEGDTPQQMQRVIPPGSGTASIVGVNQLPWMEAHSVNGRNPDFSP